MLKHKLDIYKTSYAKFSSGLGKVSQTDRLAKWYVFQFLPNDKGDAD
jgi:hypothetical protein